MKWYVLTLAACFFLAACDDDDNGIIPNETIVKSFNEKYPEATRVKWEHKKDYTLAEFFYNSQRATAWFTGNGQWQMTQTELDQLSLLPQAIQDSFRRSEYAGWQTDDIDLLERPDAEPVYVIEVKKAGQEYDLYYARDGILIKAIPDDDNDDYENYVPGTSLLTTAMQEFINTRYPQARIIEVDQERGYIEVDIIHNNRSKEVVFSAQGEWQNTHYDVRLSETEEAVRNTITTTYTGYEIDDIEKYETPTSTYYLFELEKAGTEQHIRIDPEGNVLNQ